MLLMIFHLQGIGPKISYALFYVIISFTQAYYFDGDEFDNIRWMVGDIAVVKVEDDFNFQRKIRGCDYIPKKVFYNNQSIDLEKGGTVGSLAGWGTVDKFTTVSTYVNNYIFKITLKLSNFFLDYGKAKRKNKSFDNPCLYILH